MAAAKRPARQTQDANPYLVDTTEIPMTPVMDSLHELAKLAYDLEAAKDVIDDLILDATLIGLAEGQTQRSVMLAQGREFSWRSQLAKLVLRRRQINISAQGHYRERVKDTPTPEDVPGYFNAQRISALTEHVAQLKAAVEDIARTRKRQAPAVLRHAKASIEGEPIAQAS